LSNPAPFNEFYVLPLHLINVPQAYPSCPKVANASRLCDRGHQHAKAREGSEF